MIPAAIPMLPALVFPTTLVPSVSTIALGMSMVDVTAAIAVLVWALGGLVALRIAIRMSGEDRRARPSTERPHPKDPGHGFRDAA